MSKRAPKKITDYFTSSAPKRQRMEESLSQESTETSSLSEAQQDIVAEETQPSQSTWAASHEIPTDIPVQEQFSKFDSEPEVVVIHQSSSTALARDSSASIVQTGDSSKDSGKASDPQDAEAQNSGSVAVSASSGSVVCKDEKCASFMVKEELSATESGTTLSAASSVSAGNGAGFPVHDEEVVTNAGNTSPVTNNAVEDAGPSGFQGAAVDDPECERSTSSVGQIPPGSDSGSTSASSTSTTTGAAKRDNPDSDEDVIKLKKRRRIQIVDDSSDSDEGLSKKPKKFKFRNNIDSDNENDPPNKPKSKQLKDYSFQKSTPVKEVLNKSEIKKNVAEAVKDIHTSWLHNSLDFLKPDKIKDVNKRRPHDPNYDSKTLYVPESYLNSLTPAMRQWWELKSRHMDSVLFFKVGKFYELYHMDAVVGVMHLGFCYMKGEFAHSGFPESAYAKMASTLIEKGFKVARVEQTETPEMMTERCKKLSRVTKFDKVVNREICQVSTKATCVYTAQMPEARSELPHYMYAVCVKHDSSGNSRIGVCFVESSIGMFYMSEFDDDKHYSRLLALFAEYPTSLILTERGGVSKKFSELLNSHFKDVRKESLLSKSQFYSASDTLEKLAMATYFRDEEGNFRWPDLFKNIADDCIPKANYELGIKCLGACMWYLKDSKLDIQVLSLGKFEWYEPLDLTSKKEKKVEKDYLILDAVTIHNLNLLGSKGTLQHVLDHCETAFGKRMLQRWICRPLCDISKIKERQIAVNELWNNPSLLKNARLVLKNMPDLERQLTKIHAYGSKLLAKDHPDSRAIFYEIVTYSKTKTRDFIRTMRAFQKAQGIPEVFADCESRLLRKITQFSPKGAYIDLSEILEFFKGSFDEKEAEKDGIIIPKKLEEDFRIAETAIDNVKKELANYLDQQSKFFGCKISYFGSDKKRYQLEVPENKTNRVTGEYQLEGTKKGAKPAKRYSTPKTRELLAQMIKLENERSKIIVDLNRRVFAKVTENRKHFDQAIQCLTILDVLCSLAEYARTFSQDICLPDVRPFDEKSQIIIENGRHPCIPNIDSFVPNNTKMGTEGHAGVLILTGPNMGGKSTLMRQVAVMSIMAQIGSCVPASSCQLNLIDRVFTRLGAQDDIVHGQSTFYVELSEASSILQHATQHSFVLIDELGRGTSTHDGNAIATAYVKKITTIGCRTMFSTHYHTLVDHFIGHKGIQLGHMACMVENEEDSTQESVTFLYRLAKGRCPNSYGFNAARLAGLNSKVVARGREIAKELEEENRLRNVFHIIFTSRNIYEIRKVLASML